jgi:hypothetical protein
VNLIPLVLQRHKGKLHGKIRGELVALFERRGSLATAITRLGDVIRGAWPELATAREDRDRELARVRADRMAADLRVLGVLLARVDLVTLDCYAGGGADYLGVLEIERLANEGAAEGERLTWDRVNVALADLRAAGVIHETEHAREPDPAHPGHFRSYGNSRRRLSQWVFHRMGRGVWKDFRTARDWYENQRGKRGFRAVAFRPHRWKGGREDRGGRGGMRSAAIDLANAKASADGYESNHFERDARAPRATGVDRGATFEAFEATGLPPGDYFAWLAGRRPPPD